MKESLRIDCAPENFRCIRQALRQFLLPLNFSENDAELIILAVDEACTNVLRHAYRGDRHGALALDMEAGGGELRISLRDHGQPCDPGSICPRALDDFRPGGLGVFIIRKAFDSVEYLPQPDGTLLLLRKRLPAAESPPAT